MKTLRAKDLQAGTDCFVATYKTDTPGQTNHLGSLITPIFQELGVSDRSWRAGVVGERGAGKTELARGIIQPDLTAEIVRNVCASIRSDFHSQDEVSILHYDARTLSVTPSRHINDTSSLLFHEGFAQHMALKPRADIQVIEWADEHGAEQLHLLSHIGRAFDNHEDGRLISVSCSRELSETDAFAEFRSNADVYSCE